MEGTGARCGGMEEPGENEGSVKGVGYAYFVVRLRRTPPGSRGTIGGVVERLRTGEKRAFATAAELIEVLDAWAEGPPQP
ncbi:MAG: hypothetical protein ACJ8J0_26070 [Longimicrobiaceae bacterium]